MLVLLLPFEPRQAVTWAGLGFTALEAAAGLCALALAWAGRSRALAVVRHPPLPLAALGAYAVAHLCSAAFAPEAGGRSARFALRMAAMAALGVLVAAAPLAARRKGLVALVCAALAVTALAIGEGLGLRALDRFLEAFREMPFNVAGLRRATAGSEYPNQAAAFLMCGVLASAGLFLERPRALLTALPVFVALVAGLLFTYSRGALVATGLGLLAQASLVRWRTSRWPVVPLAALAVLVGGSSAFASTQEIFRLRLGRAGADQWYRARYEPDEREMALSPGETRRTRVRVTNAGPKTWTLREGFHLSYHWFSKERPAIQDGRRTELPRDLRAGESVVLEAEVKAPSEAGRYLLVWDMVHEHTAWFSGQGVRPAVVPTVVGSAQGPAREPLDPGSVETSLAWKASRGDLWRIAADMWATRPLTGYGSDSFRWSYGPRAGRRYWDNRVFSNNTLLEAAATTGTLGALSLVLVWLSSARAAGSSRSGFGPTGLSVPVALFGLVAGLAAHGVVDYVLAFTGHYLLFAFVVGSCAARAGDA